jgi:hypothetical protein
MKGFSAGLWKIASDGLVTRPTAASIYAAKKAEDAYLADVKRDSPEGYAKAIAAAISVPLLAPGVLQASRVNADQVNRHINTVYVSNALERVHQFKKKDADNVAAAIVQSANRPFGEKMIDDLTLAQFDFIQHLADPSKGLPGVDKDRAKLLIDEVDNIAKRVVPTGSLSRGPDGEPIDRIIDLQEHWVRRFQRTGQHFNVATELQKHPFFAPTLKGRFSPDMAVAFTELGKHIYKKRTGKELTQNGVAIKLVAKTLANSMKAGIPLALVAGGVAARSHTNSLKPGRDARRQVRATMPADEGVSWGEL